MTQSATLAISASPQHASVSVAAPVGSFPRHHPHERRLEQRVTRALRKSSHRALAVLQCEVSGGLVVLRGVVSSYYLKQIAQAIALRIDGVRKVENLIDVR